MTDVVVLETAGLAPAEAKVYLALLETGSTLAGPIIKKTGLHRGTTYQVLQRLKEKGLVSSVIRGKKQYFEPAQPERLMDVLKGKEEALREALPRLNALRAVSKETQEVTVYEGIKGIRSVMDDMLAALRHGEAYYDFGVSGLFRAVMGPYWDLWQRRKRKNCITSYVIFNEVLKKKNPQLLADYYGKARFFPQEYASTTDTITYQDVVLLLVWTAKPPIAVVIKNKENAASYKKQFMLLWKHAKP